MKIIKVKRIKSKEMDGLEVEIEIDGERFIECFDNYNEWIQLENGEEKFLKRIRENNENRINPPELDKTEITELKEFEKKEV